MCIRDRCGPAYAVLAVAVHAFTHFGTRCFYPQTFCVSRSCNVFNPDQRFVQTTGNFIYTGYDDDLIVSEKYAGNSITCCVDIDQPAAFCYGVGTGKVDVCIG